MLTVTDLAAALTEADAAARFTVFARYSKQKPTVEAIPLLRKALADESYGTVKCAAMSLRKLGPAAQEAMPDLLVAAKRLDLGVPQSYPLCLEAMVAIQPTNPWLVPLIKQFTGLDNWVPIIASLRALKTIGTPEALALMERIALFWYPELNKMQRRVVKELVDLPESIHPVAPPSAPASG